LWQIHSRIDNQEALSAINQHLDLFFDSQDNLIFENAHSRPNDNHVDGIESTIPFATLARLQPNHPILKTVVEGWGNLKKENGMVIDGTMVSAEGCYTVSYPMAVIGKTWGDEELIQEALSQLRHRFVLIKDGDFYLRYYTEGKYTNKNWARGAAWFLLGYIRTIEEVGTENTDEDIINKFKEAVDIALSMQLSNGLWSCFMDDKEGSLPDASGSEGITAAIISGINLGILPSEYKNNVESCYESLQSYITPDGFLKSVAQDNRGGEGLQRSDYRVIAQMGMGMIAQLYASLHEYGQKSDPKY
jgi:rhamnogalacturonyl hydrolase YesR